MRISQDKISSLLQQEDIEGFIEAGAPEDEYSSEATIIASAIQNLTDDQINQQNIVSLISLIWIENFNLGEEEMLLRSSAIKTVAKEIMDNI